MGSVSKIQTCFFLLIEKMTEVFSYLRAFLAKGVIIYTLILALSTSLL
jgi:hypothetical protein